jgi:succinate dehydrogenase / fumarate reductase membrane anchor subunit
MTLKPNTSPTHARLRTPLGRVQGLGSAKEGADHFWLQRLTGVANIILVCFLIGLFVNLIGADHATVRRTLANPLVSIMLLLLILSGAQHMRIGMQVIIEDYVHGEGAKISLLILNTFFAIAIALTSVYAVLKLSFGA